MIWKYLKMINWDALVTPLLLGIAATVVIYSLFFMKSC